MTTFNELSQRDKRILQKNVKRGAELLDEKYPTWFTKIDLDHLELSDCSSCIAGQLGAIYCDARNGGFAPFVQRLFARVSQSRREQITGGSDYWGKFADELGMDYPTNIDVNADIIYAYLSSLWAGHIRRRRWAAQNRNEAN